MKDPKVSRRQFRQRVRLTLAHWLRPHRPYQPLFILAMPRSGSSLLLDYVGSLSGVRCDGEVLDVNTPHGLWPAECLPQPAMRHIRRSLHALRAPIRGCKLMLYQLSHCNLTMDDLRESFPTAKYLIIYRESLVEQFLSQRTAMATGQWTVRRGGTPRQCRVAVDLKELEAFGSQLRERYQNLLTHRWLREHSLLFSYEQLIANQGEWFTRHICAFLGLPAHQPQTQLVKQNSRPLAERVENYQAVAAELASPVHHFRLAWTDSQHQAARAA